jgi:peptidoglycan/xylan/chitin deacetylase (PgdA/CDA1 family)
MPAVPVELVARRIYIIRGQRVILDSDLAELYQVETKTLNQAVRRNPDRFPQDYMFQLSGEEATALRSQIVTLEKGRGRYSKYAPLAFTEHGVAMLSSVLKSQRAVQMSILIVRAFVNLRELLATNSAWKRFAAHMLMLSRWYTPVSSSEIVEAVRQTKTLRPGAVTVHFDDCYRDVYRNAMPIANACGVPATAFVSSGFVGTDRVFDHDLRKSPFRFENLQPEDLRAMLAGGMEIGAHTVNHVNLGACPIAEAEREISGSVRELEQITGRPIPLFRFPSEGGTIYGTSCGKPWPQPGARACFRHSAAWLTQVRRLTRFRASAMHKPLYLALEIEGLWPHDQVRS